MDGLGHRVGDRSERSRSSLDEELATALRLATSISVISIEWPVVGRAPAETASSQHFRKHGSVSVIRDATSAR